MALEPWALKLRPASFRGVDFFVAGHEMETGRRGTVHELPQRDVPIVEDTGRRARRFHVEAFVLGDDYMVARDRLLEACTKGPETGDRYRPSALLVHPYLGTHRVFCESVRISETNREGRMARFRLVFVEAGVVTEQDLAGTEAAGVDGAAANVRAASETANSARTAVKGAQSVRDATIRGLRQVGRKMRQLDVFSGPARDVRVLQREIDGLIGEANNLATAPADAFASIRASLEGILRSAAGAPDSIRAAYETLFGLEPEDVPTGLGASARAARENAHAIRDAVREMSVAGLAESGAGRTWTHREAATEFRGSLLERIDSLEPEDDGVERSLARLASSLAGAIPPASTKLPSLAEITLPRPLPALVLTYRLYDDADRAVALEDRVRPRNPLFLPALEPIEVLTS